MQTSMPSNITLADGVSHTLTYGGDARRSYTVDNVIETPSAASAARTSARVMSVVVSYNAHIGTALTWVAVERVSPPCGLAAGLL